MVTLADIPHRGNAYIQAQFVQFALKFFITQAGILFC